MSDRRRIFTLRDVAAMPRDLPTGGVRYELERGNLIIMAPPGADHSTSHGNIYYWLRREAEERGLGKAYVEVGVVLRRNPDTLLGPDAAFILTASLPAKQSKEGYLETIPEIVAEVRSKNDSRADMLEKAEIYLAAGVKLVWIIDRDAGTIAAHDAIGNVVMHRSGDSLTTPLLPGFNLLVDLILAD